MSDLQLQTNFEDYSREDWRKLAEAGLRGADFDTLESRFDTLESRTEDGLRRGPLFDASDRPEAGALPASNAPLLDGRPWHVCASVSGGDLDFANTQLLEDLTGGASAVRIDTIELTRRADLRRVLEGVHTELVPIIFAPHADASARAKWALESDGLHASPVTLGLNLMDDRDALAELISHCPANWRPVTIDAAKMNDAGGTDVMELALVCAATASAFRQLRSARADSFLAIELATHQDAHLSMCKVRAAKRLYAAVAGAYNAESTAPIHAVTSRRMMQEVDAWTNMLRITSAAFGAVVGGADYVTTRPFTDPLGEATPLTRRIARNQQLLMMEESRLGQVADAAHGSYFHERMTEDMAQAAWALFQQIERDGGIGAWRDSGAMAAMIADANAARDARDEPVLGVTLHPVPDDVPVPEVRS